MVTPSKLRISTMTSFDEVVYLTQKVEEVAKLLEKLNQPLKFLTYKITDLTFYYTRLRSDQQKAACTSQKQTLQANLVIPKINNQIKILNSRLSELKAIKQQSRKKAKQYYTKLKAEFECST
jgi:prefoldin subunit 5